MKFVDTDDILLDFKILIGHSQARSVPLSNRHLHKVQQKAKDIRIVEVCHFYGRRFGQTFWWGR